MGVLVRRACGFLLPLFALFAIFAILQPARMQHILADFSPRSVGIVLLVLLMRELTKAARWWYYLHVAGVPLNPGDGAANFLAGQAVGILPLGEVLRARLLREHGVPAYDAIPAVVMQLTCDMTAYALIALAAAYRGMIAWWLALLPLLLPVALAALFSSKRCAARVSRMLQRHRATARFVPVEADVRAQAIRLFRPRALLCGIILSLAATAMSAVILLTLVNDLSRATLGWADALVANALSTLVGIISLVPGGWGVADGSLGGLLSLFGVGASVAFSVTLVYRFLDSLFRTLLGIFVLFMRYRALFFAAPDEKPHPRPQPVPVESFVSRD